MNEHIETRFLDLSHEIAKLRESTKHCLLKLEADIEKLEEFASNTDYEVEQLKTNLIKLEEKVNNFRYDHDFVSEDDLSDACYDLENRIDDLEREINNLQQD